MILTSYALIRRAVDWHRQREFDSAAKRNISKTAKRQGGQIDWREASFRVDGNADGKLDSRLMLDF